MELLGPSLLVRGLVHGYELDKFMIIIHSFRGKDLPRNGAKANVLRNNDILVAYQALKRQFNCSESFFSKAFSVFQLLKREPGSLGIRTWSLYGRLYLRHFNELDHELCARLNRAYRPASKYMNMFTSPLMTIIAKNIAFVSGSIFAVCFALTCYDEDFLSVEHVLMIMTISGGVATVCRSTIPDENLVWCPESLLTAVLAHIHYIPSGWRGQAHTQSTRAQVAQLFQYRAVHLIEELVSPLLTPYILCFHLRYKALDIVDFYRNFTIELTGVGDVCSFAQMDVRKHGNPMWQTLHAQPRLQAEDVPEPDSEETGRAGNFAYPVSNQYTQAEDGKTELSLMHFMLTNPEWKAPRHAEKFVKTLREKVKKDALSLTYIDDNPLYASLNSLSNVGPQVRESHEYFSYPRDSSAFQSL
ncbi:hypothetical protein QAD02_008436 [Eretmocerus hayati]|uniref:Uncharacterized protein n=1 Tax=Eretmocerus hayati TaxID=131215 RepID=A0ACC2N6E5_9HYME|nr:hypothetical protein QAD02_008436 [Eretmocerus hayati]